MPKCSLCGISEAYLGDHLLEAHGVSPSSYEGEIVEPELEKEFRRTLRGKHARAMPPAPETLGVFIGKVRFPVNSDVPEEACLPCPAHYRVPQVEPLSIDLAHAATALAKGRTTYIWGLPGTGKDAFIHYVSSVTRRPGLVFTVKPGADIQSWFYQPGFDSQGTSWEEGLMLKALRDGYTSPTTGRKVPYLILISDFDRADRAQAEYLRLIADSIQGRVEGPGGVVYPVFPGTTIVATANTMGAGDQRGRCISSNPIDASILNRFERKFRFILMDWRDEEKVCRDKFPLLAEKVPGMFSVVGKATAKIREAIQDGHLFAEFSHRDVCGWLGHAEDIIDMNGGKVPQFIENKSARAILDGLPDDITREKVKKLLDPIIRGGTLPTGGRNDTSVFLQEGF